jgi:hypothetical protein
VYSFVERSDIVMHWRLKRKLKSTVFMPWSMPNSTFYKLSKSDEVPFSRQELERHMVRAIAGSKEEAMSLIVAGAGGLGKTMFWENLLRKRPLLPTRDTESLWYGMEGPTIAINLSKGADLRSFQEAVIRAFNPSPFLPNMTFRPEPTWDSTIAMLKAVLPTLPHPVVVYLEDVNLINGFSNEKAAQDVVTTFFTTINECGGVIVGNSPVLLTHLSFQSWPHTGQTWPHTGLRSSGIYFPALKVNDPELIAYAKAGGHLFAKGKAPSSPGLDVVDKIDEWGANLFVLKMIVAFPQQESRLRQQVQARVKYALLTDDCVCLRDCGDCDCDVTLRNKPKYQYLVDEEDREEKRDVIKLRRQLLELLVEAADKGEMLRVTDLPESMTQRNIHNQLAAVEVISFRTEFSHEGAPFDVVIPYYPYVLQAFKERFPAALNDIVV